MTDIVFTNIFYCIIILLMFILRGWSILIRLMKKSDENHEAAIELLADRHDRLQGLIKILPFIIVIKILIDILF